MDTCNNCCENTNQLTIGCGGAAPLSDNAVTSPYFCYEKYQQCTRECCDQNGKCCQYPCSARDPYWPEFTHPRCLSCAELYNGE